MFMYNNWDYVHLYWKRNEIICQQCFIIHAIKKHKLNMAVFVIIYIFIWSFVKLENIWLAEFCWRETHDHPQVAGLLMRWRLHELGWSCEKMLSRYISEMHVHVCDIHRAHTESWCSLGAPAGPKPVGVSAADTDVFWYSADSITTIHHKDSRFLKRSWHFIRAFINKNVFIKRIHPGMSRTPSIRSVLMGLEEWNWD